MFAKLQTCSVGALLALALGLPLLCQAPLLRVSPAKRAPEGGWQVTVTNNYSSPATAFVIVVNGQGGALSGRPLAGLAEDSIPGPVKNRIVLAPGQSRLLRFGNPRWEGVTYTDAAVVYANGATAGDAAVIGHIIRTRQREEADILEVLPMLASAMRNPDVAQSANVQALERTFTDRGNNHAAAAHDGILRSTDRICRSVVATLRSSKRQSPLQSLWGLHVMFQRWLEQIQASLPQTVPAAGQ